MIEYKKRKGHFWKIEDGVKTVISAEEYEAGENTIPVPIVVEYDSLEEAMADQDQDWEEELPAEED